jgi:isopentenyldiphosphate isomerase
MRNDGTSIRQNDPAELLEVFDTSGSPTGLAKPRAAIHLDGDWHLAFHCWILRRGGEEVVLQRRSFAKDTFPGCWDAAAAGHWRFGESAADAAREINEELGIEVPFAKLIYRGRERSSRFFPNGLIDHELHDIYVLYDDRPLVEYRPDRLEVIGLAAFRFNDILGEDEALAPVEAVSVLADGRLEPVYATVRHDELVPYSAARLRNLGTRDRVDKL